MAGRSVVLLSSSLIGRFVGSDPAVRELLDMVALVSNTDATVLVTGETGTGKELIARALHEGSARRHKPFVPVNCGAIPDTLLESELFGHLRGSFTGASESRPGIFEAANSGTVFLDEVADMSHLLQAKLLRVLQTGDYAPVGSAVSRRCDVRVVAASNQPLRPLVAAGVMRADLYYRLHVICLDLPPLRARQRDIPLLTEHFLRQFAPAYGRPALRVSKDAADRLLDYSYPGNVRELENAIRRAVILCQTGDILLRHLPPEMLEPVAGPAAAAEPASAIEFHAARARALDRFEREFLVSLLRECSGVVSRAAQRSGLSERHLHVKLKKYGLHGRDFKVPSVRTG